MDKKAYRERMRKKKRQMMIRRYTRLAACVAALILVVVFVIRGIILPIAHWAGGKEPGETVPVQAQTAEANPDAAIRQPLKGQGDLEKASEMTSGWHEDENGRWYQNTDGTYFSSGLQEIDGVTYSFDSSGYIQTGWVTKGVKDLYFNDDGSYNPEVKRKMVALTYDDGPGEYTQTLLDCLEENNAHATFFMVGPNVQAYPDAPKRMLELGCELGNHTWDHYQLTTLSLDQAAKEVSDTDDALINACGQASTVVRAPYGDWNQDVVDTVGKPFILWSIDSLDWKYLDVEMDYNAIMNGEIPDGSIILMHDIHEPSVQASLRIIPDLVAQGYKLVTVSELAAAKGVNLQSASYTDFTDYSLENGLVAGYEGNTADTSNDEGSGDGISDGSDGDDGYSDGDDGYSDGDDDYYSDGDDGYSDGDDGYSDEDDGYSDGESA